ncbi:MULTISPECIES: methylaspartate ammonia-lyase [Carboxydothermus]|uniref:Methylaspartate ammonia-lyase 2 n=2 Tax=Carboxydothermus TaxID=129957 RepID=MAAL2_CARHZ|nr:MULTISPECIES: methylaspartate ammonia-lyase [Carboxydothermus]Q3AEJ6.1 RecName: Full=Methylaspartate ammonia-lyase 2; Short=MAL; AltName: Full=3-methylaspartate ammonia-lyase 2; AltName: Full=Beta-methylaspartase 2 [Carboxydothermus hydrogenoformans Z-2901]ABB16209.1 methylaspartate ammonia-lyase [Carboxydothermus hydrogenoformans Z-2901]NYE56461.1 methylaspartate ammonia-lyase [Carboxydothermus ferrireducens DSM 11255]
MKIIDALFAPGLTGFYFDDQEAIKKGAVHNGFWYEGNPQTPGYKRIRQKGEAILVMLVLENGEVAYGDCAAVQYSGTGGRDPLFTAEEFLPILENEIRPKLIGLELNSFRNLAHIFDRELTVNGKPLHTALRYGLTQALLDGVARAQKKLMAEVIAEEYQLPVIPEPVPIFVQTGDDLYTNADKAIIKRADVLPHALINNVEEKLGRQGEKLLAYIKWLKKRIFELAGDEYRPVIHIDVYGTVGLIFANDLEKIAGYLATLAHEAAPFKLRIEGPVDMGSLWGQIEALSKLREIIDRRGIPVEIVADEWCNTLEDIKLFADHKAGHMVQIKTPDLGGINNVVEAVLYAKMKGIGAYLGGTCNETDRSAQISVHLALATRPDQMLAKPGMGLDEGLMIVYNEMQRAIALLKRRGGK